MSETDQTEQTEQVAEKKPHWWQTVAWYALAPRVVLGVLGLAALFVGLRAAWRTDAATPALVVAAVLIALAILFTPDLEELSARWKEAGVTYRRRQAVAYAEISEALQVALGLEEGEDFRTTIEEIASESSKAAVREELKADRKVSALAAQLARAVLPKPRRLPNQPARDLSPLVRALMQPMATHAIEEGQVTLTLTHPPTRSVVVNVRTPDGTEYTKIAFRIGDAPSVSVTFPRDFAPETPPLSAGQHTVTWRSMTVVAGDGGKVRPQVGDVVAIDVFEVSDAVVIGGLDEGAERPEGEEPQE